MEKYRAGQWALLVCGGALLVSKWVGLTSNQYTVILAQCFVGASAIVGGIGARERDKKESQGMMAVGAVFVFLAFVQLAVMALF